MSAPTKKLPTEEGIQIKIGNSRKRVFSVPKSKANGILMLLEEYEIKEAKDWREVFESELIELSNSALALKGARLREEMTQQELAEILETSQSHMALLESGNRAITKKMAKRLADIFDVGYKVFL